MQRNADKQRVTSFLSGLLVCSLLFAWPVAAQESPTEPDAGEQGGEADAPDLGADELLKPEFTTDKGQKAEGIEEIKITGQQSELTAQDEAVSVTQFSAADIQDFRIQDISDLSSYTPNLEINTAFAASNPTIFIRGIGLKDYNANSAGSVAVYTDGIYVNSPAGQLFQMFDVANVEVLRGPQGSQSARNATAGAIKVYSNKPDGEFSGSATMSYGEFNLLEMEGAFGFPVFGDIVSARISGTANFMDGYTKNKCAGAPPEPGDPSPVCDLRNTFWFNAKPQPDLFPIAAVGDFDNLKRWTNNAKNWATRGLLRVQPIDTVDVLFNFHWGQNRSDSRHLQMVGTDRNSGGNSQGFSEDNYPRFDTDPFVGWYDQDGDELLDVIGGSMTADVDFGFVHLTSITGMEANQRLVEDEGDATPGSLLATDWSDETWQVSQELRVDGDGENYAWSVGGYFLYEEVSSLNVFKFVNLDYINQAFDQQLLTWAPYAHGTWEFDEFWSVELGARYNWERKNFELGTTTEKLVRLKDIDPTSPTGYTYRSGWDECCGDGRTNLALAPTTETGTWAAPTGDVTINFEPTEDVKFYLKYARGMKGGHFNASSFTDDQSLEPVEPEFVHSGEFGIKSTWFDGAMMFNSSVFYYDYKDLQVFDIANEVGKPPVQQLLNADATALGVEAEWVFRPLPDLFTSLGFGWLDAKFKKFVVRKQVQPPFKGQGNKARSAIFDFTGNPLIAAPEFNLTGNIEYTAALGRFGALIPGFDFSFKSKVSLDPSNKVQMQQPALWLLNARLGYRTPDERVNISGWVRNITKEVYLVDAFDQSIDTRQILYVYAEPRIYGVTLSFDW